MKIGTSIFTMLLLQGYFSLSAQITDSPALDRRVSSIRFEPIAYAAGPQISNHVHAYITVEIQPATTLQFLNARLSDPALGTAYWLVQNLPLLPFDGPQIISYQINVEVFGSGYESLLCDYHVGSTWQTDPDFPATESLVLIPEPTEVNIPSGSDDPAIILGGFLPTISVHPFPAEDFDYLNRGCNIPNADLDSTNRYPDDHPVSNDKNACGPAAAANSLQWLVKQHTELAGDTTSLRSKLDSLKGYMNLAKKDTNGVRFDSMVVGKLTLIDKLKLPIRVKYQTKHESGIVKDPLASTEPPGHTADNKGQPRVYPDFDWMKKEMDDGEDVELQVGWYGPPEDDGVRPRHGGHWVVVTGYFSAGMVKGIYFKDDDDQIHAGGTREKYGNWAPGAIPYLEGMTDGKGNIAIIESVVSESYDPTVTFDDDRAGTVPSPWDYISLTDMSMKPGYPFVSPASHTFPWLPVVVGGASLGTLIYVIASDDDEDDCTFTTSTQSVSSTCELPNGSVTVTATPSDTYSYQWSNGATSATLQNISAGNYTVTITRSGTTCTQVINATVSNSNPTFSATLSTQQADCGMQNGSATASVSPPGAYTYTWSNGAAGATASLLAPGTYSLMISAGGSCVQEYTVIITENTPQHTVTVNSTPTSCGLSDGTATAIVEPPGEYAYVWSDGQSGPVATGLGAGAYSVSVSIGGTTCTQVANVIIDELPAEHTVSITTTPSTCGLSDGTATATVDPPGEYTYAWSNGPGGPEVTGLSAGEYTVSVSIPGSNCLQVATFTIDELPASHTVSVTTTPSGCGLSDGTATADVNPPGEYTYAWSSGHNSPEATGLGAGEHSVSVSVPGSTCMQVVTFIVDELPPDHAVSVTTTPSGCGLDDGTATATVDPPGDYTYAWSSGHSSPEATGLSAGVHDVSVSVPGSTCVRVTTFTVDELPAGHTVTITTTPAGCGLNDGTATAMVSPPGEYSIFWSDGQTGQEASVLGAGEYQVTVTPAGIDCEVVSTFIVEQSGGGFTATFTTMNADCGVSNGSTTIMIDPPGEYTFLWSNQETDPALQQIAAGTYSVIVTDTNSCTEEFLVTVDENPAEFLTIVSITPGNCLTGGEISFMLTTPGPGPLVVQVDGPEGTTTQTLSPGTYQLSTYIAVSSGIYLFTVYDEQMGPLCTEIDSISVPDNTPALIVTDDFYSTQGGEAVFENALSNDSGLNIEMTSVSDVFGGAVTFNASGAFTFIPEQGFSGEASFTYTVTDACGTTSTGLVTIFVEEVNCEFGVEFELTPASCGLDDGAISVDVIEPGSYTYVWSNGDSGPVVTNIPAGTYFVTITDENLGCDLVFSTDLSENPAEHISDIVITQPTCSSPGEIQFTAETSSQNPLIMTVLHPNGSNIFFIDPGVIFLSDYVSMTPGMYTVEIRDAGAGPDCTESFSVDLLAPEGIEIVEEGVIPPSEPTAEDGVAIIVATVQGVLPYTVLLNGSPYSVANDHTIFVEGLGVGDYTIQLMDANGCVSNILFVTIPFPDDILSLGTVFTPVNAAMAEHTTGSSSPIFSNGWEGRYRYYRGKTPHVVRVLYVPRWSNGLHHFPGWMEAEHRSQWVSLKRQKFNFGVSYGLGLRSGLEHKTDIDPAFLSLHASSRMEIGRSWYVQIEAGLRGWKRIEQPNWSIRWAAPIGIRNTKSSTYR